MNPPFNPKHKYQLADKLGHRELIKSWQFTHPGDYYLVMVLCRVGRKPPEDEVDDREWVTWYYNADSGGFNEGHYFAADEEKEARQDFYERCLRYAVRCSEVESDRRSAEGLCQISVYADKERTKVVFFCNNPVSEAQRKAGCGLCEACDAAQEAEEGRCDGLAAMREDHQREE